MTTLVVKGGGSIEGSTTVPGDKSISHRGLLLGAAAHGRSVLGGLGPGADVASTRRCLRGYGVKIGDLDGRVEIEGRGLAAWSAPSGPLYCGNSGTTMRILAGLASRCPFLSVLDGDESLRGRPMDRIVTPLRALGASVEAREGLPPLRVRGGDLVGADLETGVASAQVKSCVLLAALGASGTTRVVEPAPTRDHTERMLRALGAPVRSEDSGSRVEVEAYELPSFELHVPGDVSSAAFLVAAALVAGRVRIDGVGLNPTRVGFLEAAARMGAQVRWTSSEERMGEPVGTIEAERSPLAGIGIEGPVAVTLMDELPLLAVLATRADGETFVTGAQELRVKESDRIAAVVDGLGRMGAAPEARPDGFVVRGPTRLRGAEVDSYRDHRIAMALAVAALCAEGETRITGWEAAAVSWPGFEATLGTLGAEVRLEA